MKSLVVFSLVPVLSFAALSKPEVEPALLQSEGEGVVPAARISWNPRYRGEPHGRFQFTSELDLKSTLATKPRAHDESTVIDARAGWRWDPGATGGPTRVFGGGAALASSSGFPGSIAFEGAVAFEGDQPFDNRQWTAGVRLNYTPDDRTSVRHWWHPYLWLEYRKVSEVGSSVAERLGIPEQEYWRLGSRIHWQIALSQHGATGFWKPLKIVPGIQYHRSTDIALAANDLTDAWHYSLGFDYALPASHRWLSAVRVKFSEGRIPPATKSCSLVSVAVAIKWDQLFDGR